MTEKDQTLKVGVGKSLQNGTNGYHFFLKAKHISIRTGNA